MRGKLVELTLLLSIIVNIWFGFQLNNHLKLENSVEQTIMYSANMTLSSIQGYLSLTTNPKANWKSSNFIEKLDQELLICQRMASSSQGLVYTKNKNLDQIRYDLVLFASSLDPYRQLTANILNENKLISEKDKGVLIDLSNKLRMAGFSKQVQEDNGENFKEGLEKFLNLLQIKSKV